MKAGEFLARVREQVQVIQFTVEREFLTLPDELLNKKESSDRWSILECFEHLNRYNHYYLNEIEKSLNSGGKGAIDTEIRSTWMGRMSVNMMRPENRKKQKTFARMNPANSALDKSVLSIFLDDQKRLLQLLQPASLKTLNTRKVKLEFFKLLNITSAEGLEFTVVHEQRHLVQAMNVKAVLLVSSPALAV